MRRKQSHKKTSKVWIIALIIVAAIGCWQIGLAATAVSSFTARAAHDSRAARWIFLPLLLKEVTRVSPPDEPPPPTATPEPVPTATPQPDPTATLPPGITPTPTQVPTLPNLPYGPFHNSNFNRTFFNGAFLSSSEWNHMPEVRAKAYHVFAAAASDTNPCSYMPDGPENFDVERLVQSILERREDILEYASDGTLIGVMELNEPQDPNCEEFGGDPEWEVPQSALYEVAHRFWEAFPELSPATFYFGFGTPPTYIEEGGGSPDINMAFLQYAPDPKPIEEWAVEFQESAARQGMKLIYSANLDLLGLSETISANIWECQQSDALLVTLWRDQSVRDEDALYYEQARATCEAGAP